MPETELPTDLLTPLGAYLTCGRGRRLVPARIGGAGPARPLLASSAAAPGWSRSRKPKQLGEPVVGYLGYDFVATLEPTVPLPDDGAGAAGEPLRRPRRRCCASTTRAASPRCCAARRPGSPARRRPPARDGAARAARARAVARRAPPPRRACKEQIREGDVFQVVLSQRATRPTSASAVALYRALRRVNPSPYLFLLELDGRRARRLLAGDGRQVRRTPRRAEPDRGHDRARRGRRSGPARVGEGPSGAHDARRPRTQRPLARLPCRERCEVERFISPSATRTSRTSSRRSRASCARASRRSSCCARRSRRAPSRARRRCARCRSSPSSRATGAAPTPARCATRCRPTARSTPASRSARCGCTTASPTCRPGAGIVRRRDPAAEHEECLRKLAALETAIELAESEQDAASMILLIDNYDSFSYNLAHLFGELGAEVVVRRNDELDADEAERLAPSHLVISPGPAARGRGRDVRAIVERLLAGDDADARRLPRPPGHSSRSAAARSATRASSCTGRRAPCGTTGAGCSRAAGSVRGRPLPLARRDLGCPTCLERSAIADDGEVMAVRHRELAGGRRPVPSRVGADARTGRALARNFLEGLL